MSRELYLFDFPQPIRDRRQRDDVTRDELPLPRQYDGRATVRWVDAAKREHVAPATPDLLNRELFLADQIRTGNRYPRQRNYHGWYFFTGANRHVWVESNLEASRLASLDMGQEVTEIASQPMRIEFADGSVHYPDFLALRADHRQVLYDVKPIRRVEAALDSFARTQAMCRRIGWGYEVLTELGPVQEANLAWLRQFKHHGFHPGLAAEARLIDSLDRPTNVREAAQLIGAGSLPSGRSAVFHLLWTGSLVTDLAILINDRSLVERNSDVRP